MGVSSVVSEKALTNIRHGYIYILNVFELVRLQKFIFYLFTALVLPSSTLIADEVFILATYSYIYIYIFFLWGGGG